MEDKKSKEKTNNWPTTLYVEGQDQFRGWFNSSLITSTILSDQAPYHQVLSHGFVVDEKGRKMSKSLGNVIDPEDIAKKYGIDVLRLWVFSCDFSKEIKISNSILENTQESYQKIRNTLRFLLGNLANLPHNLTEETYLEKELNLIDRYILCKLEKLIIESHKSYQEYSFNSTYSSLLNFCINDLSSFYFEISKDSLYCDNLNSQRRNQIITTLYCLLQGLLKVISPTLPYLTEEVYQNIPFNFGFAGKESAFLSNFSSNLIPLPDGEKKMNLITNFFFSLRQTVYQNLEKARQEKIIDSNSQAHLIIYLSEEGKWISSELNLIELLLVAEVEIKDFVKEENVGLNVKNSHFPKNNFYSVKVKKTTKKKCLRCWNYRNLEVNICLRCKETLSIENS
ncbi:MAG: class I tRNA ligase family protein [Spiroplasmataceae bacterium]|nr:class I tRNA ligase family protein [Spiroplasmataceae bacterium]